MATIFHHWGISLGMVVTGSVNTVTTKLADLQLAQGIDDGPRRYFTHPFVQTWFMFVGEMLCLWTFKVMVYRAIKRGKRESVDTAKPFSPAIFILPACCDMSGTSMMYLGLTMTEASVFQMLRGSVVIFTGIFSVIFIGRKLHGFHWVGMFLVLIGCLIVGLGSVFGEHHDSGKSARNPALGNTFIVIAQVLAAFQMVVEERFVSGRNIPALQAVGWEGVWGMLFLGLALVVMYFVPAFPGLGDGAAGDHFENTFDALVQFSHSPVLVLAIAGNLFSIAFFNYFGISVTKRMSAVHRMVLDSIRTIVIWAFGLIVGWETFQWVQLSGFVVLLLGTMVYNEVVSLHSLGFYYPTEDEINATLLHHVSSKDSQQYNTVNDTDEENIPVADDWFSPKLTHYQRGKH